DKNDADRDEQQIPRPLDRAAPGPGPGGREQAADRGDVPGDGEPPLALREDRQAAHELVGAPRAQREHDEDAEEQPEGGGDDGLDDLPAEPADPELGEDRDGHEERDEALE